MLGMTVERNAVAEAVLKRAPEAVANLAHALHGGEIAGELAGSSQSDRKQCAFRSRAAPGLVTRSVYQRLKRHAPAHEQGTHAFWPIELVARDRQKIDAQPLYVSRHLAERLCGVGMKEDTMLSHYPAQFRDRLNRSDLVVRMHDAGEDRSRRDGAPELARIDTPKSVNREIGHRRSERLQEAARGESGRMLDRAGDDVISLAPQGEERALDGEVVGFAAAACEYDLIHVAVEKRSHLPAGL